jgi:hypothetical protein
MKAESREQTGRNNGFLIIENDEIIITQVNDKNMSLLEEQT